jgi:hypothetical protein
MDFFPAIGVGLAACVAAGGALVGYGILRQKVAALEVWKGLMEVSNTQRDHEITRLLEATATNTANIAAMTENLDRLISRCDIMHIRDASRT